VESDACTNTGGEVTQSHDSIWAAYLTGRQPAERFLRVAQTQSSPATAKAKTDSSSEGATQTLVLEPSEYDQFVTAFKTKPERGRRQRLLALLQASNRTEDGQIRQIVVDLAEAAIRAVEAIALPDSVDGSVYEEAVSTWLTTSRKRPLKHADADLLLILVHIGWHRGLLDTDVVWNFLRTGLSKPARKSSTEIAAPQPDATLVDVLLANDEPQAIVPALLGYYDRSRAKRTDLEDRVKGLADQVEALVAQRDALRSRVETLSTEKEALQTSCAAAETTIQQLEARARSMRASYMHRLDDMRGHTLGTLEGPLSRWLQTGLDAVRMDPPRSSVIEERLEEALKLIEREVEWLRRSA
jgi:hypothetical protein